MHFKRHAEFEQLDCFRLKHSSNWSRSNFRLSKKEAKKILPLQVQSAKPFAFWSYEQKCFFSSTLWRGISLLVLLLVKRNSKKMTHYVLPPIHQTHISSPNWKCLKLQLGWATRLSGRFHRPDPLITRDSHGFTVLQFIVCESFTVFVHSQLF